MLHSSRRWAQPPAAELAPAFFVFGRRFRRAGRAAFRVAHRRPKLARYALPGRSLTIESIAWTLHTRASPHRTDASPGVANILGIVVHAPGNPRLPLDHGR